MRNFKFKMPFFKTKSPLTPEEKKAQIKINENDSCVLNDGSKGEASNSSAKDNYINTDGFDAYFNAKPWG